MDKAEKKTIEGNPAPYPASSSTELTAVGIFANLIDAKFIKADIRVLDKYPNSDGIIDITDAEGLPLGKIDVQLKTLPKTSYQSLSFSCPRTFLAYCRDSVLPVILAVINIEEKTVFWQHIGEKVLSDCASRITGDSVSITIPRGNEVSKDAKGYIQEWTKLAVGVRERLQQFGVLEERNKEIEQQIKALVSKFTPPSNVPAIVLKRLYDFVDIYNYILDIEFRAVKNVLYPGYWKTGIGIIHYSFNDFRFILYPVISEGEQLLVRQVEVSPHDDIFKQMVAREVFSLHLYNSDNDLEHHPKRYAYKQLEGDIKKIVTTHKFPIPDLFAANEYLTSFIDSHVIFLDMEEGAETYSIKGLKNMLYNVLPMRTAISHSYADHVREHRDDIDSYMHYRKSSLEGHRKGLAEARKRIDEGFIPVVKVTMTSTWYDMELINYYIGYLEKNGKTHVQRQYKGILNEVKLGNEYWKNWDMAQVAFNLRLVFNSLFSIYTLYIETHFPVIKQELKIRRSEEITVVCVLYFEPGLSYKPFSEIHYLRPRRWEKGQVLFYESNDPDCPIVRENFAKNDYTCVIQGKEYDVMRVQGQQLDFLFTKSPLYEKIMGLLDDRIKELLKERTKKTE